MKIKRLFPEAAIKYCLACATNYHLPETTGLADKTASFRKN